MPRTAPTYTGTPAYVVVGYRLIDANSKKGSVSYITTLARATSGNIELMAAALSAASNANLWDIVLETHTDGAQNTSIAVEAPRESVNDVIMTLTRDPVSRKTQYVEIPAPLDAMFLDGTNQVDTTNTLYQDVNAAANVLLPDAYVFVSVRFSEHHDTNPKQNF